MTNRGMTSNLIFKGIKEVQGENYEKAKKILTKVIANKLGKTNEEVEATIIRAHRGKYKGECPKHKYVKFDR